MKIAINHRQNSYSDLWIEYCQKHNILYKIVDAYANDIIEQIADCDAFMWHHHFHRYEDYLFARQLIYVIEKQMGKITYPNIDTCWHYDDKVGQKYLLEAIGAPIIPTYIFYSKQEALDWVRQTTFPKVFKLRSGASSENVQLVRNQRKANRLINKAFSFGFEQYNRINGIKEQLSKYGNGNSSFRELLRSFKCLFVSTTFSKLHPKEIGYVYFQDFIPNNDSDIRVLVIGNRAIAKKRMNRTNDFRASGSHINIFDSHQIDLKYIITAFKINKKLKMQSVAFDFLHDSNGNPLLTEISYCSGIKNYKYYSGYWTDDLQWHECDIPNFCNFIIEDLIAKIKTK
jgi:glutathione synthase/RimK-type ligase-like ATP-grasp enzyme